MRHAPVILVLFALAGFGQTTPFFGTIRASAGEGQTLYATTAGGYFKSTDAGVSWRPFYITEPGLAQPAFAAIAVDPARESTVYVATAPASGAIWKSTDAGSTWARANTGLPESGAVTNTRLFIAMTGEIYLRLDTAIYKSRDGAVTWARIGQPLPGNSAPFDINYSNPRQMLYAQVAALWRSTDEGATWQVVSGLQTFQAASTGASCLATDPLNPSRVYICVAGATIRVGNTTVVGLHRSNDGGSNITPPPPFPAPSLQPIGIHVDQTGGQLIYLANSAGGYCKSSDYGQNIRCPADTTLVPNIVPTSGRLMYLERRNANVVWASAGRFLTAGRTETVMLRSRDAGESWQVVESRTPVTLAKSAPVSAIAAPSGSATAPLAVAAIDLPTAAVPFTTATSGEPWFSVSALSGTTPANLTVTFRTAGLAPGSRHEGSIRITSPAAANESVTIPVVLQVARLSTGPVPRFNSSIFAGDGTATFSGDGGLATAAGIGDTGAIVADRSKNIYFVGGTHVRIRRVNEAGRIDTIAGNGTNASGANGATATQAALNAPRGLAIDNTGIVYFGESGVVRQISGGLLGTAVPSSANIFPSLLAVDPQSRLWIAGSGRILRYSPPASAVALPLSPATTIIGPAGFAIDGAGSFYASDSGAGRVYRITPTGALSVYAGNGSAEGIDAAPALATGLESPTALAADRQGNLYILESRRNRIRMVNPEGTLYTVSPTVAGRFLRSLATDEDGNLYASASNYIYKFSPLPAPAPNVRTKPRNGASGEEAVSPGSLFYVDGEDLANVSETAPADRPWGEFLGGASATINGRPVPLSAAAPNRLSGQIPYDLEPGAAGLVVTTNGNRSPEIPFDLLPVSPGIFTMSEDNSRAADAVVENGEASVLVTGFGPVDPPIAAGAIPSADAPSKATIEFQAMIGEMEGQPVEITLVPGKPGLGRARFKLPEGLAAGDHILTIRTGEVASNSVTFTVP